MEKKIITDKDRIAKLKERRSVLNDQVANLTREVRALKKEVRAEQFVNGSLRSVIYGSSPFYGVFQISRLLDWVGSLIKEKLTLEDAIEDVRFEIIDKQAKKFKLKTSRGKFCNSNTKEVIKKVQWIYSEN
jgi:hypothetical protein